jgi:uncharacterized protein YjiS (DUF1127 family)
MQFDKQFHGGRSPFVLTGHGDEASGYSTEISALPASSGDDAPRRSTVAAASQLIVRTVAGFAASAEIAFPNFLLIVASRTFAQALAGCAAYGEAMYPGFVGVGEPMDCRDPVSGTPSERRDPNQPTSGLSEISSIANDKLGGRRPFLASRQTQSSAADLVKTEYTERSEGTRAASAGSSTSNASFIARFRSRISRGRDSRLAIAELRAFDDRRLRDIGISRCDIEHPAGRGDRCE